MRPFRFRAPEPLCGSGPPPGGCRATSAETAPLAAIQCGGPSMCPCHKVPPAGHPSSRGCSECGPVVFLPCRCCHRLILPAPLRKGDVADALVWLCRDAQKRVCLLYVELSKACSDMASSLNSHLHMLHGESNRGQASPRTTTQRMCQPQEAVQTQRNQTMLQRDTPAQKTKGSYKWSHPKPHQFNAHTSHVHFYICHRRMARCQCVHYEISRHCL